MYKYNLSSSIITITRETIRYGNITPIWRVLLEHLGYSNTCNMEPGIITFRDVLKTPIIHLVLLKYRFNVNMQQKQAKHEIL